MSGENTVRQAEGALREEHRELEQLMGLLEEANDLSALVSSADALRQALTLHFAHEEHPGGLYDSLKICVPEHRRELAQLVEDHRQMGAALWQLYRRARELDARFQGLRTEVAQLVAALREHERREHELAKQAVGVSG
jgi:uncharacterized coiled-coil DUF342 family protein